ncbi:hypothetical protein [Hyphomicrobium sp.]|uniref:type IV secretory system conjugative DNA transfer family protein n=1 Tax=Hyphomicrobium sp. TaxID=82 RepID=UPI002E3018F1|nr:hypothetical protein [Hyphomicrobium sp.]HEX2841392.1 hypothetical protein [Hyphomicrobium sp.]
MNNALFEAITRDLHAVIVGGTRRGKSGLLELIIRFLLRLGLDGVTLIDPHGSCVRAIVEWLANPLSNQQQREILFLDPSSSTTFGLNCLEVPDTSWESCHLVASILTSILESRFEASPEQTPRLARIVYVAAMFCARRRLTLVELVEVLSLSGEELRQSLLSEYDNYVVRRELDDLHALAERQPARFLEVVESAKNRFVRWLGDPRLARILGQQHGLNPRTIMDSRSIVLADFSGLNYQDAAFLGCIMTSMYFAAARFRPPLRAARHRLILDESESLLTVDVARMLDQTAKMGLIVYLALQRLGQARARGDFLFDAIMTNCGLKVGFGGLEPESSRYMAEHLFGGFIDLCEWKPGSERPVAVGSKRETVRSKSTSRSNATHEASSSSESIAQGRSTSRMHSITEAEGESVSDSVSEASAIGSTFSEGGGASSAMFESAGASQTLTPPPKEEPLFLPMPEPVVLSIGESTGSGSALTSSHSWSAGESMSRVSGSSYGRAKSRSSAVSHSTGVAESEVFGRALGQMRGRSMGQSESVGESEAFTTVYEWLPSSLYTLEEQLHRLAGELANLPRRECFVKIEDQRPFRMRTADLAPTFRSASFKRVMLPVFIETINRRSRYLMPADEADRLIAARIAEARPETDDHDFAAPEPARSFGLIKGGKRPGDNRK